MEIRAHKAFWLKADMVIKAVARWHAATNEPVIVDELQPIRVETVEITDLMGQ